MSKKNATKISFQGFISPRFTQVPDVLFDELMAHLSGAELKVLLYIIRRTFGFKKDSDNISLNQICNGITTREGEVLDIGTGLSQQSAITASKRLVEINAIIATKRTSKEKGYESTTYSLLIPFSKKLSSPSPKIREALLQKFEIQHTVLQQTVNNTVNGVVKGGRERNTLHKLPNLGEPSEKTEYVAKQILKELGDKKSQRFYHLVAAKIPEPVIRETLAAIRADGARDPARLFTYKIKQYALERSRGEFEKRKQGLLHSM
jgi:Bacteriophage replication protein O